jgi:Homing endonuclease associated repeat
MTKQEIMAAIFDCKEKLGHVPTRNELVKNANISREQIRKQFGSYTQALRECNLERPGPREVRLDVLFRDWAGIVRTLKKVPTSFEYEKLSQFSQKPLTRKFGGWSNAPAGLKRWAEENGEAAGWEDVLGLVRKREIFRRRAQPGRFIPPVRIPVLPDRPSYGALMRPCALLCEPTNEASVLFLFAAMAEELGFAVLHVQAEFPDCEALRIVAQSRVQRVRIEFEFESRNFERHGHDPKGCDLIVCWEHNWMDCPLEVLELKKALSQRDQEKVFAADLRG